MVNDMKKSDMNRSTRSSRSSTIGRVRGRGEVAKTKVNQRNKGAASNLRGKPAKKKITIQKTKKSKSNPQSNKSPIKKIMPSLEATIKNRDICTKIEPTITTGKAADKKLVVDKLKSIAKNASPVKKSVRISANSDKAVLNVKEDIDRENFDDKEILSLTEENVNVSFKTTRTSGRFQVKSSAIISNEKSFNQIEKCETKPDEHSLVSKVKTIGNVITTVLDSIANPTGELKTPNTVPLVNDSVATSTPKTSITMPISSDSCIASLTANTLISSELSMVSGKTMVTSKPLTSPPPPMIRSDSSNPISNSAIPNIIDHGSGPQQQWVPIYVVDLPNLQKSDSSILRPMVPPTPMQVSNLSTSPVRPSLPLTSSTVQTMGLPRMVTKPVPIAARMQKPCMKTKAITIPNTLHNSASPKSVPIIMPIFKPLSKNITPTTVLTSKDNFVSSKLPVKTNYDDGLNKKQEGNNLIPVRAVVKPDNGHSAGRSIFMKSQLNPNVENTSVNMEKTRFSNDKDIASPEKEVKCVLCEKVFPSLEDMQEHYLKTHKGRKSREKNKRNMESSATQTSLEASKNTNKEFNEGSEVSVANGSRPHPLQNIIDDSEVDPKCPVCSCGFRTADEVKRHVGQVHSYICSECNITFYTLFQFTSHKCSKVAKKVKKNKKVQNNNTITSNNNQSILTSVNNNSDSPLNNPVTKYVAIKPKIFVAPPCDDSSEPPVLTAEPSVMVPLPSGNHMSSPPPLQKISNISVMHDNPWILPSQSEVTPSSKSNKNSATPQKPRKLPVIETNNIEEAKKLAKKLDMESPDEKTFKPEVVLRKLDQLKANGHVSISFIPKKKRNLDEILEGDEHLEYVCGRCNVLCFDSADYMDHIQECLIMSAVSVVPVPSKGPRRFLKLKKEVASFAFDDQNNNNYTLNRNLINKLSQVLGPTMGNPKLATPLVSPDKSNEKMFPLNPMEMATKQFQGLSQPLKLAPLPPKLTPLPPKLTPVSSMLTPVSTKLTPTPPKLTPVPPQLCRLPSQLTPSPQLYGTIPVSSMQNAASIPFSGNIPYTLVSTSNINSPTQYIHPALGNISVASAMKNVSGASAMSNISLSSAISNVPIASGFSNGSIPTAISNVSFTTANSRITIPGVPNIISKPFNPSTSSILSNKSPKTTPIATEKSMQKKVVMKKAFSNVIVPKFIPRSQVAKTTKGQSTPSINVKPACSLMTNPTMVNTTRVSPSVASSSLVRESGKSVTKIWANSPVRTSVSKLTLAPISTLTTTSIPTNSFVTSISSGKVPVKTTTVSRPDPNSISSYIFTPQISKKSSVVSNVSPRTTTAPSVNNSMVSSEISRPTHSSFRDLLDDDEFPQQPQKVKHQSSKVMEIPFNQQVKPAVKVSTNNLGKSPAKKGLKLNQPMVMIPVNQSLTKGSISEMMAESKDICSTASSSPLDLLLDPDDIKMEVEEEVLDDIF